MNSAISQRGKLCRKGHDNWMPIREGYRCRSCSNAKGKRWKKANQEKVRESSVRYNRENRIRLKEHAHVYYSANRAKILKQTAAWQSKHLEINRMTTARWRKAHPGRAEEYRHRPEVMQRQNQRQLQRRHSDLLYRLRGNLRSRLTVSLRSHLSRSPRLRKTKKTWSAVRDLGCTMAKLKSYLESQFTPGMSWRNYGLGWEIDHVLPIASFDLSKEAEIKKACRYTNLQPLWVKENRRKGSRILAQI